MFVVGDRWQVERVNPQRTIVGNLGNSYLPASIVNENRTVEKVQTTGVNFKIAGGRVIFTPWPKASEVIEARPGLSFLRFQYEDSGIEVTMTKQD